MNGLVKTLIKPDWDDNPKRSEILHAANLLHIGEFQLKMENELVIRFNFHNRYGYKCNVKTKCMQIYRFEFQVI